MATRKERSRLRQGGPVRLSIALSEDVHLRLRAAALVRRTTVQDVVAALIEKDVAGVRLPSIGGQSEEPPPGRAD